MWLIIYKNGVGWDSDTQEGRVFAIESVRPPGEGYNPAKFVVKEWDGATPKLAFYDEGFNRIPSDLDPTGTDPNYAEKVQQRVDFEDLATKATTEISWLEATIPVIDTMTVAEVRDVVKRLAQENLETIKAWRYIFRRLE